MLYAGNTRVASAVDSPADSFSILLFFILLKIGIYFVISRKDANFTLNIKVLKSELHDIDVKDLIVSTKHRHGQERSI